MKRYMIDLQTKGNIGKSTIKDLLGSYLTESGVKWAGFDLDSENQSFCSKFDHVKFLPMEDDNTLQVLATAFKDNEADTIIIDPRAHQDSIIGDFLIQTDLLSLLEKQGNRVTLVMHPYDQLDALANIQTWFQFFGNKVDYLLIRNEKNGKNDPMWGTSNLRKAMLDSGAHEVNVPLLPVVLLQEITKIETFLRRAVTFRELVTNQELGFHSLFSGVLNNWIKNVWSGFYEARSIIANTPLKKVSLSQSPVIRKANRFDASMAVGAK